MYDIPTLFILGGSGHEHYRLFRDEVNIEEFLANANLPQLENINDVTWVLRESDDSSLKIYKDGKIQDVKRSEIQPGDIIFLPVETFPFSLHIVFPSKDLAIEKLKSIFCYSDPLFLISEFYPYGKATTFQTVQAIQKKGVLSHQLMVQLVKEERQFSASDLVGIEEAMEATIKLYIDKGVNVSSLDAIASIPFRDLGTLLFQKRKRTRFIWDKVKRDTTQFLSDLNVLYEEDLMLELADVPWSTQIEEIFSYPGPSISTHDFREQLKSKTSVFIERFIAEPLMEWLIVEYDYGAVYSDNDYERVIEKPFIEMMKNVNRKVDRLQQKIQFEEIRDIKKYRKVKKRHLFQVDMTEEVRYQITIQPIRQAFTKELRRIISGEMDQLKREMRREAKMLLKKMEETYEKK